MNAPRRAGVQLHPTSLPRGRLGDDALRVRRLAGRRGAVVVADAAARAARPLRLALQGALGLRGLAGAARRPRRAGVARARPTRSASARRTGSRTGRASAAPGALDDQVRFEREWSALRAYAAERGVRLIGDVPIYVAPGGADHARAARALPRRRGGRRAAGRLHRQGAAVGQPALRLAGAAPPRLPLVGGAAAAHLRALRPRARSTTSAASSPTGRCRAARATPRRALGRGPGRARCSTPRARELGELPLIAEDLGVITPPVDAPAPRARASPAWWCSSSASIPTTRTGRTTRDNHERAQRRLHRHARPRHGARLVGVARERTCARAVARGARRAPASTEREPAVGAHPPRAASPARWRWCRRRTCSAWARRRG